ncbi:hypothetical protein [Actinoplanes sp. NPDC049118]|uniref:hypothetical protein n=1 Tax=Actinoplanes sp. NPDC049118 TaxID=3155769 RepID=UPI0033F790BF
MSIDTGRFCVFGSTGDGHRRAQPALARTAESHQSLVVRPGDGTVIVAGRSHDHAVGFTGDVLARRAGPRPPLPFPPAWMDRLPSLDPARVVFAHDDAVRTP